MLPPADAQDADESDHGRQLFLFYLKCCLFSESPIWPICGAKQASDAWRTLTSMKTLARQQLESRKAQAVRFTRDVLGDDDRADEIEGESVEDYAERKHIKLVNPGGEPIMSVQTRRELLDRIKELESENEDLQTKLDDIADLVAPEEEDEDESGE